MIRIINTTLYIIANSSEYTVNVVYYKRIQMVFRRRDTPLLIHHRYPL